MTKQNSGKCCTACHHTKQHDKRVMPIVRKKMCVCVCMCVHARFVYANAHAQTGIPARDQTDLKNIMDNITGLNMINL
jgi:hypothetical protein